MSGSGERLAKLAAECSTPGWDSYEAKPLQQAALDVAAVLLTEPIIVPTSPGGVQFEWHRDGWDIEIEILPDGTLWECFAEPAPPETEG